MYLRRCVPGRLSFTCVSWLHHAKHMLVGEGMWDKVNDSCKAYYCCGIVASIQLDLYLDICAAYQVAYAEQNHSFSE